MADAQINITEQDVEVLEDGANVTVEVTETSVAILEHPSTLQGI